MGVILTRILRLTRHRAEKEQLDALQHAFGGFELAEHSEVMSSDPEGAVARFDELASSFDVVEVVLPIELIGAILNSSRFVANGGMIIKAAMNRKLHGENAIFEFDHYDVIKKVDIVVERLW